MARALALVFAAVASLQVAQPAKPDFSGTWKLDPSASVVAPGPGGAPGSVSESLLVPIVVKQDAKTMSITAKPGDDAFTFTYNLDGSTSKLPWPAGPGSTADATAVAKWDGNTLRIATRIPINGAAYNNTEAWSIANGRLTIELVTSHGKESRVYTIVKMP